MRSSMANAMQGCVREADNSFAKRTPKLEFFRDVGAPLIQKKVLSGPAVTIEWIERGGRGSVDWRYRQDRDALFYFEQGVVACLSHGSSWLLRPALYVFALIWSAPSLRAASSTSGSKEGTSGRPQAYRACSRS